MYTKYKLSVSVLPGSNDIITDINKHIIRFYIHTIRFVLFTSINMIYFRCSVVLLRTL